MLHAYIVLHAACAELTRRYRTHCNTSSFTYQQHGFQLLPALVVTRQVVEATRVNDLICHVDLLLLDHVAHQAFYAVRKHDLLPPCCLLCRWLYAAAGICRA
jgi:hypothetical protein